jgi:hypothetical protein
MTLDERACIPHFASGATLTRARLCSKLNFGFFALKIKPRRDLIFAVNAATTLTAALYRAMLGWLGLSEPNPYLPLGGNFAPREPLRGETMNECWAMQIELI